MLAKIGFAGDLHKRPLDISTITGYVDCTIAVQKDLRRVVEEQGLTHFVSLGDWYDRGYASDIDASSADIDADMEFDKLLKGNFYGVIGNHIRLRMDSNPELSLIQPHPTLKSRRKVTREHQVIKTPDVLRIGDVQISFMHHSVTKKSVEEYKPTRQPWATYHIAIFHTPKIVPSDKLIGTNYQMSSSPNTAIARTLQGVDLALCGDIHNAIGKFIVNTGPGVACTMVVPGSLTNTDSSEKNRHTEVMMPIITIEDDSSVKLEFLRFDLKTNMLTFHIKSGDTVKEKLLSTRIKEVKSLYDEDLNGITIPATMDEVMSLNAFMAYQRYTEADKDIVRSIINDPSDISALIKIANKQEENVEL